MATISQPNGGPASKAAPGPSGPATGAAATFMNLISLLLGSGAASTPAQDPVGPGDDPAATDDKSTAETTQTNSGTNVILIALSPPAACAPVVTTAGAAGGSGKIGTADGIAKAGDEGAKKKRRTPEQKIANDLIAMTASQTPSAAVIPLVAPRLADAGAASAPAAGVPGGNSAAPLPQAGFTAATPPAPNIPEPPVAFVLELKPNDKPVGESAAGVQNSPAQLTQPAPAAVATDMNAAVKPVPPNPGKQAAAPDTRSDSAPAVSKADQGLGNGRDDSNGAGRAKQEAGRDRQQERDAPVSDGARPDSILKPADATPIAINGGPRSQPQRVPDMPAGSESIARPTATTMAETPKQTQVREISFQSASPEAGAVKIQVIDRGGDVRISVRSSDPNLTNALQRDVGQLVTKLDHSGYEAKAWNPRDPAPLAGVAELRDMQIRPETGSNSSSGQDSGSRGGQGGAYDQSQQQRRHGDARQWTSTLDDSVNKTKAEDEEDLWQA